MIYVVMFSTGAASAEVAYRLRDEELILVTADTMAEDDDNWRFAHAVVDHLEIPSERWIILRDGRTPMQLGRDNRVVPNDRMAICSRELKRKPMRRWLDKDSGLDPATTTIALGYDWTEEHRITAAAPHWEPWTVTSPLLDPPYLTKSMILDAWRARGIEPPRLYKMGFSHANCGGGCVRGGQAQWELLHRTMPDRYLEWEAEEEETRALLDRDVSILAEQHRSRSRTLPLRKFRLRLEAQPSLFDGDDWGACDCMTAPT